MMEDDSKETRFLNVEYIQEKLDEGFKYTEEAKGKDLVLVIGNTGVGKSTTCNYLLGQQMKEEKYKGWKTVIETVNETDIKIGHDVKAETLYAKTIPIRDASAFSWNYNSCVCLLDCPGFLGNRTEEERVIESISTELAIRNARQIKGILILISLYGLQDPRLIEVRELVKTLISLFKNPVEMVQYSVFIVTKKDRRMEKEEAKCITVGALRALKEYSENQAKLLSENRSLNSSEELTHIDYDRIATYFSEVVERLSNIIIIDPLDNGESRKLIVERINSIKERKGYFKKIAKAGIAFFKHSVGVAMKETPQICPISINDFNFSKYDENREKFNRTLYDRAHDGYLLINKIHECKDKNLNCCSELANYQARLTTLEQLQSNLTIEVHEAEEGRSNNLKINFQSIKNLESIFAENEEQISLKENEIKQNDVLQGQLSVELKSINTDTPIVFIQKDIYHYFSWWKFFGWIEMKFNAKTSDTSIPIIDVKKEMENGYWIDEVDRRKEGIYKVTYQSKFRARPGRALVITYVKTKDEAGNQIRIEEINDEIVKLKDNQIKLKSRIEDIKCKNKSLQTTIELAKSNKEDYKNNLKQKLKECKNDIQHHSYLIEKMQKDMSEAKISGLTSLQELLEHRNKFDIVVSISTLLEFPSILIKRFVSQYNEFLSDIDAHKCFFDENDTTPPLVSNRKINDIIDLKDPITGGEIKDLVTTLAGTAFDEHSLLKQFDQKEKLPFVFKHEDESLETIKYLQWHKIPDIQSYLDNQRNQRLSSQNSQSSLPFLTKSELRQMTLNELKEKKDGLEQEIHTMKEQLETRETALDQICRQIKNLEFEIADKNSSIVFDNVTQSGDNVVEIAPFNS